MALITDKIKIHSVKYVDEVFTLALKGKPLKVKNKRKKVVANKNTKVISPKNLQ